MRKGITPIIAIIILLLITIALAGSAWVYLTGYVNVFITSSFDVLPGSFCRQNQATILVRNIGSSSINTVSDKLDQINEYGVDGNTVVLYHLNDITGDTAVDEAGGDNSGTVYYPISPPAMVNGKLGLATHLSGSGDYINVPITGIPQGNNNITYEAWVKITQNKSTSAGAWNKGIVVVGFDAGNPTALAIENNTLMFVVTNSGGVTTTYNHSVRLQVNKTHHIAASYSGGVVRLYIDGNVQINNTAIPGTFGSLVYIGTTLTTYYLKGIIDEVRISNVSRDFTQLQQGWNYVCEDRGGNTFACGDFTVARTSGTGAFEPRFQTNTIVPKNVSRLIDPTCSGKCTYRLITASGGNDVNLVC